MNKYHEFRDGACKNFFFQKYTLFFFITTPILENIDDISRNLLKYSFVIVWLRDEIDAIYDLWHFVVQIVTIREFYDNENKRII